MGIAWINYINLATARSVERAKEVGIRKVLGAFRNALITQFLLESVLLNLLALVTGILFAYLLAPSFNTMMGLEVPGEVHISTKYALLFTTIFLAGTFFSGLYPAFVLSGYKPVKVLKGAYKNTAGGLTLRKGLIVFQFGVSVILIVGTIIVFQQVNYMRNQKLGANINQNLVIEGPQTISDSLYQNTFGSFKNDLAKIPAVKSISGSTNVMGQEIYWTRSVKRLEQNASVSTLYLLGIDYDFIPHYEMQLAAGRNYSRDFPSDLAGHNAIINEEAVKILGFKNPEDALNKKITINDTLTVVGVLKSFHHLGLQKPIDPQLMVLIPNSHNNYSIKIGGGNMQSNIASIEKLWKIHFPRDPFNYFFLDEFYNQQYKSDQQFGKMFTLFAFLAILIACFGLLGLSSYNVLQRTKEVSIRKVLGASLNNILYLLSKDFLLLVALAFILAVPVGWWIMYGWLQDFAYRISINGWVFVVAGIISTAIAVITISFQAIKTAIANPVKSLKNE
jgi:putative ABC transport system permease protein